VSLIGEGEILSEERITYETAGYGGDDELHFDAECQCGPITDGVGFAHNGSGGWVVSFDDLREMFTLACKARGLVDS
jgi:hypothetical protein